VEKIKTKLLTLAYFVSFMSASFLLASTPVKANQLTARSLQIQSAQPGLTGVWHEFTFTAAQSTAIGSIDFLYCTQPLGACTAPTGLNAASVALGTTSTDQTINAIVPTNTYALGTGGNAPTANEVKIEASAANAVVAAQTVKIRFTNVTNPTTTAPVSNTFFVRITTYNTTSYGTPIDDGVVASAIVPLLSVSAKVQEVLNFCVDNATVGGGMNSSTALGTDCSNFVNAYAVAGTSVDIGIADNSTSGAVSPAAGGNNADGIFMVRSNALNGLIVGYRAVQQVGTNYQGALRVVGSTCTATGAGKNDTTDAVNRVSTDRCFNSATTKTTLTSSVEQFGMTGRFINRTSSTVPTANLSLAADYDSTATTGYAWDQSGNFVSVATSVPSTDKVVDDEAVVLGFAAVAALTTPPGQYTAQADYIAIPTY
jgi:hypothetical protein